MESANYRYYKTLSTEEVLKIKSETQIDYERASRNCWYDKIVQRQNKLLALNKVLEERK